MVPLSLVRVLTEHLLSQGVAPQEVLGAALAARLEQHTEDHFSRLPAEDYCQLLLKAAEHLHDPLLGLHLGQGIRPTHLGALGYVLLACENLGAALTRIQRYHRLVNDINPIEPQIVGDQLELRWGAAHGRTGALYDESGITGIVQIGRDLCGERLPVTALDFINPPPRDARPYERYFGCKVRFGQPMTRLVLPLASLASPLRQTDPTLLRLMERQVDAAMSRLPVAGDLGEMARRVIAHLAPQGLPELPQVAHELRLSPRVFYRRLAAQGLNFRDLRETALRQVAEMHLRDERLTLAEVGALLGYSEQSAFSRAFKRWAGMSPQAWRQQQALSSAA
ncbi:MAG TPA: AraC family transcriptional regulator [Candidatus Aquabacterium excrementipullorum]|nr:AraC family transcriptional regulator [Candidatus Aquabacterium excrementipullorum]